MPSAFNGLSGQLSQDDITSLIRSAEMERAGIRILAGLLVFAALAAGCTKILSEHLDTIRVLADLGDANMQQLLGDMYLQGHGVPLDYARIREVVPQGR